MPPYVPRKRVRDATPPPPEEKSTPAKRQKVQGSSSATKTQAKAPPRKPTLFDDLDASSTPRSASKNGSSVRQIDDSQDDDDESSLTSLSDGDFEDVLPPALKKQNSKVLVEDSDDDDDIEFEDVEAPQIAQPDVPVPSGDLELTLIRDTRISLANSMSKKGPSKIERKIRIATHCVHVQLLLWHNALRNAWLCDPVVQGIMLSHVPPRLFDEVGRWRTNSGLEEVPKKEVNPTADIKGKGKGKGKTAIRTSRDWSEAAQHLEKGAVDMSHGDPLFRLMKVLSAWWKQRFRVTAPGLRKWGYMPLERLDRLTKAFKQQESNDQDQFGEQVPGLEGLRQCAQDCRGSRDIGAQLFTALLRALGLEARLVANLQTLGFGWNKLEEADPEKEPDYMNQNGQNKDVDKLKSAKPAAASKVAAAKSTKAMAKPPARPARRSARTETAQYSSDFDDADSDDELAIEVPPSPPRKEKPASVKPYDTGLEFPHYWTEVLSPVTQKYLPVDVLVKSVIATNRELTEQFEPRGGRADKAKQMIAYVVAYSQDGTAKDVTVRYLKRQMLPGRTKGNRIPIEKVPVYNRHGKVKRYDQFDWFKSAMRGYVKGDQKHPITETDELEDSTDLKPAKTEKKEVKEGEETLQYYKQSKEFCLERHLKREEALIPNARPVKMFKNKGANAQEEPVYSRKDVVQVKSAETWHKQGRAPIPGEMPLKRVPYRAATTNRRREIAEVERATGEKVLQGLYSFDQTEWIIPPPIENGVIPKNEYGNIDLFVEHMCPEGAVHVPYRGAMRVAKRLGIDYAEAVVDFEFGHRMAVPVIQGVVIAEEYRDQVMEELAKDEAEKARKEDEKRRKAALGMWRKFIMGLRIIERIRAEYGHVNEDVEVFGKGGHKLLGGMKDDGDEQMHYAGNPEDELGGGFLPEGFEVEEEEHGRATRTTSGFFPVDHEHDEDEDDDGDEDVLEVDHGDAAVEEPVKPDEPVVSKPPAKSVMSTRPKRKAAAKAKASSSRRRRRNVAASSSEDEDDEAYEVSNSEDG
ncbi:Rad4 transglutaminase-like domain-containing protein [Podospora australis]|uniref:Rad4 transglutaminase-like domain-containing protein n=1 Tax=Podospora australis TaxID=1536484 RepID=A0AAN6WVG1_9PEZI|nr:Rad4 transglutaminase-like domain-containing protein [Podospora australis]